MIDPERKVQWNLDFSNHGTFPLDLLQSNTVILPAIFGNSQYFEPILASHGRNLQEMYLHFLQPAGKYYSVAYI